MQQNVGLKFTL